MTTESPDLSAAMHLVDELIDCKAQLHDNTSLGRRAELESAIRIRALRIWQYLESAND